MSYQLANAKVWDGSAWVEAAGGGKAGQDLVIAYASDFLATSPLSNTGGVAIGNFVSVNVTANSSAHTFGAWTQLQASAEYEASAIAFFANVAANGQASGSVIEIGVGASGSEAAICQIAIGSHRTYPMIVPVKVASGARVSARLQSVVTGGKVATVFFSLIPKVGDFGSATTVDTYGVDLATSRGINTSDSGATSAVFSAWTEITASTTRPYRGLVAVWSASNDNMANTNHVFRIGTGASGSEVEIGRGRFRQTGTEQILQDSFILPFLYIGDVPQGTRLSASRTSVGSTVPDVCILGIPYL